jgi:hypothetical protein
MAKVGRVLAERLNRAKGPVAMVLPLKGWSIYGAPGGPLHDAAADAAFVQSLTRTLHKDIAFHKLPLHINDPEFAQHCCQLLMEFMAKQAGSEGKRKPRLSPDNHPSERGSPGTPIKAARKLGRARGNTP